MNDWLSYSSQKYSTFMQAVVGDVPHQKLIRNAAANAMVGIVNATGKYAPD